ncbi:stimulated by retinoic acid gene 6 protein-like isoform X2 [Physella acuta]|uniref:stimulated by retinoic acid gene 6 protein-like isoform X2 n=1 Tax=Physella acuta TaxID=109671 RepID=UPI0027DD673C|nr:stimulated by retinoic acid gene 6 protein-like isoform X2 [Physella acuta]
MAGLLLTFEILGETFVQLDPLIVLTQCQSEDSNNVMIYVFQFTTIIIITLMSVFQNRLRIFPGRYGLVMPIDTLTSTLRLPFCCCLAVVTIIIYEKVIELLVIDRKNNQLSAFKAIVLLSYVALYSFGLYPLFASLNIKTCLGYGISTLYVWILLFMELLTLFRCHTKYVDVNGRLLYVLRFLPFNVFLLYLSIKFPLLCLEAYKKKILVAMQEEVVEKLSEIRESFEGKHVRKLLTKHYEHKKIKSQPPGYQIKTMMMNIVYEQEHGFIYPTKMISSIFVAFSLVYMIDVIGYTAAEGEEPRLTAQRSSLYLAYTICECISYSALVAVPVAFAFTAILILHMIAKFRSNMFSLYKGDYSKVPPASAGTATKLCIGSLKYAGYQVAYILFAYCFLCVLMFTLINTLILCIYLIYTGSGLFIFYHLTFLWGIIVFICIVIMLQFYLTKIHFLQGQGLYLRLNNRRAYNIASYFLFFCNIFIGIGSFALRIFRSLLVITMVLGRMETNAFPRIFEFFDPGFRAYLGYLHLEASHTNPVLLVFIRLLKALSHSRKAQEKSTRLPDSPEAPHLSTHLTSEKRHRDQVLSGARVNWLVAYTLLQNPTLRIYRRGFIQLLNRAMKEGLKLPISDKPIYLILSKIQHGQKKKKKNTLKKTSSKSTVRPVDENKVKTEKMIGRSKSMETFTITEG